MLNVINSESTAGDKSRFKVENSLEGILREKYPVESARIDSSLIPRALKEDAYRHPILFLCADQALRLMLDNKPSLLYPKRMERFLAFWQQEIIDELEAYPDRPKTWRTAMQAIAPDPDLEKLSACLNNAMTPDDKEKIIDALFCSRAAEIVEERFKG